jgi:hypothetical protein
MISRWLAVLLVPVLLGSATAQDVVEKTDVVVPTGPFRSPRKVDSETLILPNAGAVLRAQQRRTAAQEARDRAAARAEAARELRAARPLPAPVAAPSIPVSPEAMLVEESVQSLALQAEASGGESAVEEMTEPEPVAGDVDVSASVEEAGEDAPESAGKTAEE